MLTSSVKSSRWSFWSHTRVMVERSAASTWRAWPAWLTPRVAGVKIAASIGCLIRWRCVAETERRSLSTLSTVLSALTTSPAPPVYMYVSLFLSLYVCAFLRSNWPMICCGGRVQTSHSAQCREKKEKKLHSELETFMLTCGLRDTVDKSAYCQRD